MAIRRIHAPDEALLDPLCDVLVDAVRGGSSIGFLWPLSGRTAKEYWREVFDSLSEDRVLWVAETDGHIIGSVQLERCRKQNGRHRAEVLKLLVHTAARRRGIAGELMEALEAHARDLGCTLLVLDTEAGSSAESVYRRLGFRKGGEVPEYAATAAGELVSTAYFYKRLAPAPRAFDLVRPARDRVPQYRAALERGWCADNVRPHARAEEIAQLDKDAETFVASQFDPEAKGPPIELPDGSKVARIPGYRLWMWDGEFCGIIGLRWQPGTTALPAHVLGHIGYSVVPWKRQLGYATRALALMLGRARDEGLEYVELTTDPDNVPSQRTIVANGGVLVERFRRPPAYGETESLRYRIRVMEER
jgi:predicted acetyltransferase